jgi:flagellar basal-body rod modification protein FlgD
MLETSSIQAASGQATTIKGPDQTLGQDQFLNLLIAQLKNQDPLNPIDNAEFMAQLAQFSQLEQTKQMASSLNAFIDRQDTANATSLVTLLGKHVTALGSEVSLTSGTPVPLSFTLGGSASTATLQILNSAGVPVRTFAGTNVAGPQNIMWDGKNDAGTTLPNGNYTFSVNAKGPDGAAVSATTQITGVVTSIRYDGKNPVLVFEGGQTVSQSAILNVKS